MFHQIACWKELKNTVTLEELTALVRRMQQQHRQPVENTAPAHEEPPYQRPAYAATFPDWKEENE